MRLIWAITNRCNFSCNFCYSKSGPKEGNGLDSSDVANLLQKINTFAPEVLTIIGGEPFIRKDLGELVKNLDSKISINLDTNGSLLVSRWTDDFEKIHKFNIGIDGFDGLNSIYRKNTKDALKAILFLIEKNKKVSVSILITPFNILTAPSFAKYLLDLGVVAVQFNRPHRVRSRTDEFLIPAEHQNDYFEYLKSNTSDVKERITFANWYSKSYFENAAPKDAKSCMCGSTSATIGFNGELVPCLELTDPSVQQKFEQEGVKTPNLLQNQISECLNTDMFRLFRSATTAIRPTDCQSCQFNSNCSKGCRVDSFMNTGFLNKKPISCEIKESKNPSSLAKEQEFWKNTSHVVFSQKKMAEAPSEVDAIISLTGINKGLVVDLGCGNGRHLKVFAESGLECVGIDTSFYLLQQAYKQIGEKARLLNLDYRQKLAFLKADLAVCLYNSIGLDKSRDLSWFGNVFSMLNHGGKFVLDFEPEEAVLEIFKNKTNSEHAFANQNVLLSTNFHKEAKQISQTWTVMKDGLAEKYHMTIELFSQKEVFKALEDAGFSSLVAYSNFKGERASTDNWGRVIIVAQKP